MEQPEPIFPQDDFSCYDDFMDRIPESVPGVSDGVDRGSVFPVPVHIDLGDTDQQVEDRRRHDRLDPGAVVLGPDGRPRGGDGAAKIPWEELSEDERAVIALATIQAERVALATYGYSVVKPTNLAFAREYAKSLQLRFAREDLAAMFRRGKATLTDRGVLTATGRDGCGELHLRLHLDRVVVTYRSPWTRDRLAAGETVDPELLP